MEFRLLRNFSVIVELSSITAAAERLGIAQPALSRQVKILEQNFGVPLLYRHGRGVTPTEEGSRLVSRAKLILEDMKNLQTEVKGDPKSLYGTLTLGLPPTVADVLATHLIIRTMEKFPDVNLRIVSGFSGHVQDWLTRDKIDLGVAYEGQKSKFIKSRPILLENLFLIQPAQPNCDDTPITAQDALRQPLILPNSEHGLRSRVEHIAQTAKIDLNVVLEVDILPTMLSCVERGLGSTILPLVSVIHHIRSGQLVARPIVQRPIDRTLVLMTPLNRPISRLPEKFSEFMISEVHHLVSSGEWSGTTL